MHLSPTGYSTPIAIETTLSSIGAVYTENFEGTQLLEGGLSAAPFHC